MLSLIYIFVGALLGPGDGHQFQVFPVPVLHGRAVQLSAGRVRCTALRPAQPQVLQRGDKLWYPALGQAEAAGRLGSAIRCVLPGCTFFK